MNFNSRACQLAAEYHGPVGPGTVRLKYVLGQIQADDANLIHGRSPRSRDSTPTTVAHSMPPGGVHPIAYVADALQGEPAAPWPRTQAKIEVP